MMWWKLGILGIITVALLFFLLAPTATMTIKVDLPPGAQHVTASEVKTTAQSMVWATEAAMVGAILLLSGLIGWRIVRHHRISN